MVHSQLSRKLSRIRQWIETSRSVHRKYGKSMLAQIWEIFSLRFAYGRLSVAEYYNWSLYNDRLFSYSDKREFIGGRRAEELYRRLNNRFWYAIANDKLVCYAMMQGLNLPYPRLYAIFHPVGRFFGSVPCFKQASALADFLRHEVPYPFFSKPVHGAHGEGAALVIAFDRSSDRLIYADGKQIALEQYIAERTRPSRDGYLFQECLVPDPMLKELCGPRVSSLRMIVLLGATGPRLFRAIWKVPVGRNMTDNFARGSTGNMLGQVDTETGLVKRVITGLGIRQSEAAIHPDTGKPLTGFVLPNWDEIVKLCLTAATALPGLRLQHWDIAMCPQGPVIIELNGNGNLNILQHTYAAGLYDTQFRAFLVELSR
jgi:hypothetical protein